MARKIWRETVKINQTLAEKYLRQRRGITLERLPISLRFHPSCYHGPTQQRYPAMIGLMTDALTNQPRGVHRTFLNTDGTGKADIKPNKMMLGPSEGAVVRLVEDVDITYGLGIAEGIESALSVMASGWSPVWSTLSAGNMADFPVRGSSLSLTLFADNDESGTGLKAANTCAARWHAAGREVRIVMPNQRGSDWNG